jgi:hypothetical protein
MKKYTILPFMVSIVYFPIRGCLLAKGFTSLVLVPCVMYNVMYIRPS